MKLYYIIKNFILGRTPHFSTEKYLKYVEKSVSSVIEEESGLSKRDKALVNYIQNNTDVWYIDLNGAKLTQLNNYSFTVKNKKDNKTYSISKVWVEWKKNK
jgi:hypothetical protein